MVLIGATTENPYFEVNSALLSRSQIYELRPLTAEQVAELLRRALRDPERGIPDPPRGARRGDRVPGRPLRRRRPRRVQRAGAGSRDRAAAGAARDRRACRGRDAEEGGPLRQGRRQALRLHLGVDQVDARLGRRRLALLPRGDARGRRGPALHRAPDDRARLRGHRQRRPAGAGGRGGGSAGGRARRACRSARSTSARRPPISRWRRSRTPARRRSPGRAADVQREGAADPPSYLQDAHYLGARKLGRGVGYEYPHDLPGGVSDQSLLPEGMEDRRYYEPTERGFEAKLRERLAAVRQNSAKTANSHYAHYQPMGSSRSRQGSATLSSARRTSRLGIAALVAMVVAFLAAAPAMAASSDSRRGQQRRADLYGCRRVRRTRSRSLTAGRHSP